MRFHSQICGICKVETLFLEKLIDCKDPNCSETEDICQSCNNNFYVKEKIKLKK